jgi:Xaa-Pro aminopeptidase
VTGTAFDYPARVGAAQALMAERDVDALLLSVGSDLPYLSGYTAMANERLTMFVLPASGEATMVVPLLEAPRVEGNDTFTVRAWHETEDPVAVVARLLDDADAVALGDQTWSTFLLGLQELEPRLRYLRAGKLMAQLRIVKSDAEIDLLRAAGAAVDRVVPRLAAMRFGGRTEIEVSREVKRMTVEEGSDLATFAIVASGPNAASPHHEPGERVIALGDAVVVDFGGTVGGYCSDTTRTFHVGEPTAEFVAAYEVLQDAQAAGVAAVAPGVAAQEIDRVTRAVIERAGYGEYFIHRTGHGIGLDGHEDPYLVEGNEMPLRPGMAFSVEPGIYVPGRFGMRIEDIVVATDDGSERLNLSYRSLHLVQ